MNEGRNLPVSVAALALGGSLVACGLIGGAAGDQAGASVGDLVWADDGDGVYEENEEGLPGVLVRLYAADGSDPMQSATTDDQGNYRIAGLEAGEYLLEFVPPDDLAVTLKDQGSDDALDSDPDPNTHRTDPFSVGESEALENWDAGMLPLAALEPTATPTEAPTPTPSPPPVPTFRDPTEDTMDCSSGSPDLDPVSDITHVTWEQMSDGSVVIRVYIVEPPEDPSASEYSYAVVVIFNPSAGDNPVLVWEWHNGTPHTEGDSEWAMLPGPDGGQVPGATFRVPADQLPEAIQAVQVTAYHMASAESTWWCDQFEFTPPEAS